MVFIILSKDRLIDTFLAGLPQQMCSHVSANSMSATSNDNGLFPLRCFPMTRLIESLAGGSETCLYPV